MVFVWPYRMRMGMLSHRRIDRVGDLGRRTWSRWSGEKMGGGRISRVLFWSKEKYSDGFWDALVRGDFV